MAIDYGPVQCRSCNRVLAVVSATGLASGNSDSQGCDTCKQFSAYHNAVQTADKEWAKVEPKRDSLKARQIARLTHMQIHMEFDNWLISVEANQRGEPQTQGHADHVLKDEKIGQQHTKRALSDSPTSRHTEDHSLSREPSESQEGVSLSLRPSSKRSGRTTSLPNRKRLKFSDTVEFRDDYRDSSEYLRTDENYVRGRYAPPDGSEYLDTSGSAQTFLRFTGMRRVKGDWVEVTETDTATKRKGRQVAVEGTPDDAGTVEGPASPVPHKIIDNEGDQRALRLARRTRKFSAVSVTQQRSAARPVRTSLHQQATEMPFSRPSEFLDEPCGDVAIKRLAPRVDEENADIASKAADEKDDPLMNADLVFQADVASEQWETGMAMDEQAARVREGSINPSEEDQSLVVPHGSGASNGYASVVATLGARAAQHGIAQHTFGNGAHKIQTEPPARIGEVPTPLQPNNKQPLVPQLGQKRVLDDTDGLLADPPSPSEPHLTGLTTPCLAAKASDAATVQQATVQQATVQQATLPLAQHKFHAQNPAAVASHLHSSTT